MINSKVASRVMQHGAGMIEVLVALVILAIGLLGVLSMQAQGLRSNQQAVFNTEATMLASDMANRILAYTSPGNVYSGVDTAAGVCAGIANPTVQADCDDWVNAFDQSALPSARGSVEWAADVYTITIRWDHDRIGTLPANNTVLADCAVPDPQLRLTCYQLELQP